MAQVLQLDPESELQFVLSYNEETSRCTMTLRHNGSSKEHLAFKVKTTQPRRYLVRPNQGLVAPGGSEKVAILLVDKDKQALLKSYESLGQSALDHAKDKFLVQSCTVSEQFSSKFADSKNTSDNTELYEALNSMWSSVTGSGGGGGASAATSAVQNKKLHVRLLVKDSSSGGSGAAPAASPRSMPSAATPSTSRYDQKEMLKPHENSMALESMTPEQLLAELGSLRRKYDELVSFSVNLTAERDILNNTLEQTKRELNREVAARASLENKAGGAAGSGDASKDMSNSSGSDSGKKGGGSIIGKLLPLLIVGLACFLGGIRSKNAGAVDFLEKVPVIKGFLVPELDLPESSTEAEEAEGEEEDDEEDDDEEEEEASEE